ncbi:ATP-binding cassette subfamily B protein [Ezakiella coagulans]|uniref:ATP-binding cassette subfamily B protein n=1 Tax=Ezakiella coagulans TaxID=46507 RepID=A0A2U1E6V8_9FIRM|nr:ABC transporter ATP-binding protein [Ezakiella coagulans]PVY95676.1 ATP-binding cassette subfamily B protein [Ezakiella coagulans]
MKMIDVYRDINKINKNILPVILLNCLFSAIEPFVFIFVSGKLVKYLIEGRAFKEIVTLSLVGAAISLAVYVIKNITENYKMEFMDYLNCKEKNLLIKGMFNLDFKDFESKEYKDKISRHRQETDGIGGVYYETLYLLSDFVSGVLTIIIAAISLGGFYKTLNQSVDIKILGERYFPLILLAALIILSVLLAIFRKKVEEKNEDDREEYSVKYKIYDFYMRLLSDYESLKQIKIFDEKPFIKRELNDKFVKDGLSLDRRVSVRTAFSQAMNEFLMTGINVLFLLVLAVKAIGGLFGADALIIYYGAFKEIVDGIKLLIESVGYKKSIEPKIEILYDVIALKSESDEGKYIEESTENAIVAKNICFAYPGSDKNTLEEIDVTIKNGEKIAIVGENGSGKTTFINLLTGLYRPTSGEIFVNGKTPTLENTSKEAGVVSQDFFLFSFMLGENVTSSRDVDVKNAKLALETSGFGDKYPLETYLYKDIDEDGVDVSGGEAQKIALARAIYGNKKILLFDEPTSKLDPKSEMKVFESFNEVSKGKTSIFVSHRMSACKFADRIILFEKGKISAIGTHEEMIRGSERYREMWEAQAKYFYSC